MVTSTKDDLLLYSAFLFACSAKLWLMLAADKNSKCKLEQKHILCITDNDYDINCNEQMTNNTSSEQSSIMSMSDDITFHLTSYLNAQDMLHLALSFRRFGIKDEDKSYGVNIMSLQGELYFRSHSLMDEAAMRQLAQNTTPQQFFAIPRSKGDTWLRLLNNPPKIRDWRTLNQYQATGNRSDRAFMMRAMGDLDIQLFHMAKFGCSADITDELMHLVKTEPLFVLGMEGPKEDWGGSSGYCWEFTRSNLEKGQIFKGLLARLDTVFHIHMGVLSVHKFDWCYNEGECMGTHRLIFTFGGGKKMLFTDGKKQTTLILPHSGMMLSDVGEKLVKKLSPPYFIQDPSTADDNATPKTDSNERSDSIFLMLDVSAREDMRA